MNKKLNLNPAFKDLWDCKDRHMVLYGSRGSSKSNFVSKLIVKNLVSLSYYKCIAIRKEQDKNLESTYAELKNSIIEMGLEGFFLFTVSPLKIVCKLNKNSVLFRGMDDLSKIKSINNPTSIWWEEEVPESYNDYMTASLSLRSPKAEFLQEIFTVNPIIEDFENHWFWKKYFKDENEKSFRKTIEIEIDGKTYYQNATIHHSTWRDNLFLRPEQRATYEALKNDDPTVYAQSSLGIWTKKTAPYRFYKKFNISKNSHDTLTYRPDLPLHLSFDFNTNPYITCAVFQGQGSELYQIDEFCLKNPHNTTKSLCEAIKSRYKNQEGGAYIYGDANGYHKDTRSEKGENDYTIIFKELGHMRLNDRTTRQNPSVKTRGDFINQIFENEIYGIKLLINVNCTNTVNDFLMTQEDKDGSKLKQKVRDKESETSYEKYGHLSDACDYLICQYFYKEYQEFKTPNVSRITSGRLGSDSRNRTANY